MKTKLLLLLFMALSMGAYAQGNLQFNQVLTFNIIADESNVYTVPVGKVAKITTATMYIYSPTSSSVLFINGFPPGNLNFNNSEQDDTRLNGAWLKAGDVIDAQVTNSDRPIFLSIIEYNIISP